MIERISRLGLEIFMIELKFKNFIFDCDSTLTKIEGLDFLAKDYLKKRVSEITERGMAGEISFEESLAQRLKLVKPSRRDLTILGEKYMEERVDGSKILLEVLTSLGGEVFIVSGGMKVSLDVFADFLGVRPENTFGVDLAFHKNGSFAGIKPNSILASEQGKREIVSRISGSGPTVFVGDGATDLAVKDACDLFIGFGGVIDRKVVREGSMSYYSGGNILGILDYLCFADVDVRR